MSEIKGAISEQNPKTVLKIGVQFKLNGDY